MGLETATIISDLNPLNPTAADPKSQGDDQLRMFKGAVKNTFPGITGAVTATHTELNYSVGVTSGVQAQFGGVQVQFAAQTAATNTKGAITGQTWSGTHDYSTGFLRAAAPVTGSDVATKLYADSLSFAAALPVQTGQAGKIVATDGTTASWVERTVVDTTPVVYGSADSSKRVRLDAGSITTGQTRVWTSQDRNGTVAYLDDTGLALVSTPITPTAVSAIDITFTSAYDNYQIVLDAVSHAGASESLSIRFFVAGVIDTTAKYATIVGGSFGAPAYTNSGVLAANAASISIASKAGVSGTVDIFGVNETARPKNVASNILFINGAGDLDARSGCVNYIGATAVTGMRLYWSGSSNFNASGKIRVYGWKNS